MNVNWDSEANMLIEQAQYNENDDFMEIIMCYMIYVVNKPQKYIFGDFMKGNVFVKAFLFLMTVGLFIGCGEMGNRNVISQQRAISQENDAKGFNGIKLEGVGDVNVYPGQDYRVIVTTDCTMLVIT
jgi:hypothetical protein